MRELALNILDIAQNSIKAKSTIITIAISAIDNILTISIEDNGCGMSSEFLQKVRDPFTTTRTTRKVGMGIPLFQMGAESSGGNLNITSEVGVGTIITATYKLDHIDRMPLGDVADTMSALIMGAPNVDFVLNYKVDKNEFNFCTQEVRTIMGDIPLDNYEVLEFIREYLISNITNINGGLII